MRGENPKPRQRRRIAYAVEDARRDLDRLPRHHREALTPIVIAALLAAARSEEGIEPFEEEPYPELAACHKLKLDVPPEQWRTGEEGQGGERFRCVVRLDEGVLEVWAIGAKAPRTFAQERQPPVYEVARRRRRAVGEES